MRDDWVSPWWQAVLLPERWDVCGVSVPPLSVWHTFALEQVGNRYLCGGEADKDDASSLLLFASRDMAGGRALIWRDHARARAMRRMWKRLRRVEWSEVDDACSEYVDACLRAVSRWQKGGGKPMAVPYQWHIVCRLSGGDPAKWDAAWNAPYAQARCVFDAAAEAAGDDSLMSPAAQEMEDNWDDYKDVTETREVRLT